jgi:heme-degrading monooxygenase HmoA
MPARLMLAAGLGLIGAGLLAMRGIDAASTWSALLAGFCLCGLGVGLVNPPLSSIVIGVVTPAQSGMASGMNNTFRQVGIATGIAGLGAVFQHQVHQVIQATLGSARHSVRTGHQRGGWRAGHRPRPGRRTAPADTRPARRVRLRAERGLPHRRPRRARRRAREPSTRPQPRPHRNRAITQPNNRDITRPREPRLSRDGEEAALLTQPHDQRREQTMSSSTISADTPLVTLVNVFTVDPANQEHLIELWQRATDEVIRHLPGFISANIHRSLDGTKVVNYAQWNSRQAFLAMLNDPASSAHLKELAEIGTHAPVLCEVVSVHHPADTPK